MTPELGLSQLTRPAFSQARSCASLQRTQENAGLSLLASTGTPQALRTLGLSPAGSQKPFLKSLHMQRMLLSSLLAM